ncbi:short-chain dehydrogenase [Bacillaceae bacterium W0354]
MKHALIVGGTGMLSRVSLWLIDKGYHVSVIARNANKMNQLLEKTSFKNRITPILVDYRYDDDLRTKIRSTIDMNGDIDLVVAWIHSDAPNALEIIKQEVSRNLGEWELYHVLGSSTDVNKIKKKTSVPKSCLYYQVRLGFVIEDGRSRWLTHNEISNGVIESIKEKNSLITIGQIEPWDKRP